MSQFKIRVSKILEKTSKGGKVYFTQAVNIDQFPKENVTVWHRFNDKKYAYPEGGHTANLYLRENVYTNSENKTTSKIEVLFKDFQPL